MASGHVNRINRPNTWLLRPDVRRTKSSCQRGAVHTWHIASGELILMSAVPPVTDIRPATRLTHSGPRPLCALDVMRTW
jgi:hypothetical protein